MVEREVSAGWESYRRGDWAGAERSCQNALMAYPSHARALGLLGALRLTAGRAHEAEALLTRALQSTPRDAMLLSGQGLARLMQGNAAGAEQALRGALKWGGGGDAMLRMRLGMALGAQGKVAEAVAELRRALQLAPDSPDVMLNLANALAESGVDAEAESLLKRLLARVPAHGDARFNLGTLYTRLNRLEEAQAEFRTLLTHYPGNTDAHNSLGVVLERQNRLEDAGEQYRKALELDARHVLALNNLGNVLRVRGEFAQAQACYDKAQALAPAHVDAYLNLGMLRVDEGRPEEARALFDKALSIDPKCIEAALNLGEACRQTGALNDARAAFLKALDLNPDSDKALNGLGNVLRLQGEPSAASKVFLRATQKSPRDATAFLNMGLLCAQQGQYEQACTWFRQAVAVDGACKPARLRLAEVLRIMGHLEEAGDAYRQLLQLDSGNAAASAGLAHVQQHQCHWDGIDALWSETRAALAREKDTGITPFSALSIPTTPQEQLLCSRAWAAHEFGWILRNESLQVGRRSGATGNNRVARDKSSRINIGYLSWDFHEHATAYLMAEVFELHNRDRFNVTAYSYGPDDGSPIRQRIRRASDAFVDIAGVSDVDAARQIMDKNIDILIDLKGYTMGARTAILAYRPAPVQVNWLGFPGTMGMRCIDWIIADRFVIPEGAERFYDEKVYRLPDCYQPNDRQRQIGETPSRAACGLPEDGIVFCCFNQPYKILPDMFASWMRILTQVQGSVLWLLDTNPSAKRNLVAKAVEQGVSSNRVVFAPHKPLAEHLARYRVADLALDTFPYTSHTTASDALWAGCPLVALAGDTFASRVSGSILQATLLQELIAYTIGDFEELAVRLAISPEQRLRLRDRLQSCRESVPLFDAPRFVGNLEQAFQHMHEQSMQPL